jgi:hypothetical protein
MDDAVERQRDDAPAGRACPQAKVDVAELDRQLDLIEAAEPAEHFAPHRQQRAGYALVVPDGAQLIQVPIGRAGRAAQDVFRADAMIAAGTGPQQHSGMLQRAVRVHQATADDADLRPHRVPRHLLEQAGRGDLDVVIEQQHYLGARCRDSRVDHAGEIERSVHLHDARAVARYQVAVHGSDRRLVRGIVDNHQFGPKAIREIKKADASFQQFRLVSIGDHDGERR